MEFALGGRHNLFVRTYPHTNFTNELDNKNMILAPLERFI